jgi:glycosyltransferase involved in cell wall biosynthesis
MRLLFVTPYYFPELQFGGPPKRIHAMSKALVARGHQLRVVTFHSERPMSGGEAEYDGVAVRYLPWLGKALRQIPLGLSALKVEIERAEIIHCYGLYNLLCPAAARLARRHASPYLLEPMGMYVPRVAGVGRKRIYHALFTNRMARGAAAIVATSPLERDELRTLGDGVRIVVRRNGIDLNDFANLPSRSTMRDRWQVAGNDRVILYLGRINEKKNLEDLILAFREASIEKTLLVIAGPCSEPWYLDRLRRLIETNSGHSRILLEGPFYNEEHLAALSAADLFVLPSINENFGNAAAEAVAAGVPVLITNTCGVAPLIDGRAGLSIPLGVAALVNGLATMLDPENCAQLTAKREEVKRELAWDEPIAQTEALYQSLLKAKN